MLINQFFLLNAHSRQHTIFLCSRNNKNMSTQSKVIGLSNFDCIFRLVSYQVGYWPVLYQEHCKCAVLFFSYCFLCLSNLKGMIIGYTKKTKREKCTAYLQRSWHKTGRYETNLKMQSKFDRPITFDWVDIFL